MFSFIQVRLKALLEHNIQQVDVILQIIVFPKIKFENIKRKRMCYIKLGMYENMSKRNILHQYLLMFVLLGCL